MHDLGNSGHSSTVTICIFDGLTATTWHIARSTLVHALKAAKYETQKPSTCRATLFRCKFLSMFPVQFALRDQLVVQQKHLLPVGESCWEK